MNVEKNENTVISPNSYFVQLSDSSGNTIYIREKSEAELAAFIDGLRLPLVSLNQDSEIQKKYGEILADCQSWWKNKPKSWWLIVIWPFLMTFIAAGGDSIINNIINKIFPTKDEVEVICNVNIPDNFQMGEKECEAEKHKKQEESQILIEQIVKNLQKIYSYGNQGRKDYPNETKSETVIIEAGIFYEIFGSIEDFLIEKVQQELLKHRLLLEINGGGTTEVVDKVHKLYVLKNIDYLIELDRGKDVTVISNDILEAEKIRAVDMSK